MRTTEKDILWICKGHYDKEKYPKLEDALTQYYKINYDDIKETLSYEFMYKLWFRSCVKEFLTPGRIHMFWYYVISEECMNEKISLFNGIRMDDFYEIMFWRVAKWMMMLSIKKSDGTWFIDMSDYIGKINVF